MENNKANETVENGKFTLVLSTKVENRLDDALENIGKVLDLALDGELFESNQAYNMLAFAYEDFQFVRKLISRRKSLLIEPMKSPQSKGGK